MKKEIHKIWRNGEIVEVEGDINELLNVPYTVKRLRSYNLYQQLDYLYNDIQAGLFGDAAKSGQFCQYIESIKEAYPKA